MSNPPFDRDTLSKLKILENVNIDTVEGLLMGCEVRQLAVGDVLLEMGQQNERAYMLLSGKLSIHLESATSDAVAFLSEGETVGELSLLDGSPTSAFVVAAEASKLLVVSEERFWQMIDLSHDFAINLLFSLAKRLRANNSAISSNMKLTREYKRNAMIDGLTSLYNRRWIEESLPRFINRYGRSKQPLAVLIMDVDHFKKFNDTYGHPAGDRVLISVATTLKNSLRPTDYVARYGGEEFLVILPDTDMEGAVTAAERLRLAVSETTVTTTEGAALPRVTISLGGALFEMGYTMTSLIAAADTALYQSKHNGRNRATFAPSLNQG
jgi:diguanylate cyclase (GGDEF)-like protein